MPDDVTVINAYEQDFFEWGLAQAQALRTAGEVMRRTGLHDQTLRDALQALDWENLAEEIEGLARRDRRELASRLVTIIEHLAKLQFSTAEAPRAGWISTVRRERDEAREIIRDSPSLGRDLSALIARKQNDALRRVMHELGDRGETVAAAGTAVGPDYSEEQVMGEWFPAMPAARRSAGAPRRLGRGDRGKPR